MAATKIQPSDLEQVILDDIAAGVAAQATADGAQAAIDALPVLVYGEVMTGTPNDVLTDFTVANAPTTIQVFKNGLRMNLTEDYTVAADTVTFVVAPSTGAILVADYQY